MVFVLGGAQSDFARHFAREGTTLEQVTGEVIDRALEDARVDPAQIGVIHVGNAFGELFTGQAQMGALPATARPALWGIPASRHEAACASGSMAILAAMADLEAGRYDCALVVGIEQERNVAGDVAARHMGSAAWVGREGEGARYLWPHMFSRIADVYAERWGLERAHLEAIAAKNLAAARDNPFAQTRTWTPPNFADEATNPIIEGRLRRHDCAQVTDGVVAVVLASPKFRTARARIAGWGHRTAALGLEDKLARHTDNTQPLLPHVARALRDALDRASLANVRALAALEVHDCFTITEYLAIDHAGLCEPGEAWREVEKPTLPINRSGGLIGGGHPVGATGVRMLLDATRQVTAGATRVGTLNLGGSATTVACFVVEAT